MPAPSRTSSFERQALLSLALLLGIVASLVAIAAVGFDTLSSARAYVGGEALWSKAQKDAVYYLIRYAQSRDSVEYDAFVRHLSVPEGDRVARLELDKPRPDYPVMREGFLRGRNHPDDIPGMARFYRRFREVRFVAQAIEIWAEGDSMIAQLKTLGSQLNLEMAKPKPDETRIHVTLVQVYATNLRLTRLEDAFSAAMGAGARWAERVLLGLTFGVGLLLLLMAAIGLRLEAGRLQAAQESQRASELQLTELVQRAQFGIIRTATDGRVLSANPALVAMLGYDAESEVLRLDMGHDVYADAADRHELLHQVAGGSVRGAEVIWKRRDGTLIQVRLHGRMVVAGESGPAMVESFVEDVTQQRALEAQLRQAQKMEAVGQLTGGLAHDFNNLLSVILSTANLVADGLPPGADQARADLAELERAARRGGAMIRKLLAFSRAEQLQFRPHSLAELVEAAAAVLRRLLPSNIIMEVEVDPATPLVHTDPAALEQVLLNLATNARDAMPEGGTLRIVTGPATTRADAGWAMLAVTDSGHGMTETVRQRYFEPFFTTKPPGEGTGLGTAMIYGLVQQHGGRVEVDSAEGQGTTVRILLPGVDELAGDGSEAAERLPAAGSARGTILLAEDEPQLRRSAQRILERFGYRVMAAADGLEALDCYRQAAGDLDLIITDVVMPRMGGAALLAELARLGSRVPVLITSGYAASEQPGGVPLPEGVPFLAKPWDAGDLLLLVQETLSAGVPTRKARGA
ncbi:MAG TPA: ATP-binding protein [Gemmatimonadales bacterium]|nr:ATP-binding protein [Gemmatimonadales bacterium]